MAINWLYKVTPNLDHSSLPMPRCFFWANINLRAPILFNEPGPKEHLSPSVFIDQNTGTKTVEGGGGDFKLSK